MDNKLLQMALQYLANGGEVTGVTGIGSQDTSFAAANTPNFWAGYPGDTSANTSNTNNQNQTPGSNPSQTISQIGQIASTVGKAAGIANSVLGSGSTGTNPGDSIPNGLQDINGNEEGNPGLDAANGDQFDLSQFGDSIPNGLQDINPDSEGNPGLSTASDPNSPESQSIANASGTNSGLLGDVSQGAGDIAGAAGIAGSIASGNDPKAAAQIAAQINPLAKQLGLSTPATQQISALGQDGMAVMGLLQGIQQGGVSGDLQAAGSAAKLASVLAGAAGQQAFGQILQELPGPLAAAAALYTFGSNWQSGDTGGDALRGAEAGAAIGTMVVPVVGTIVGAVIGGAIGALSSVFGGGKEDPENVVLTKEVDTVAAQNVSGFAAGASLSPSQAYTLLAGAYDGGAKDMNNYLGKTGEINLVRAMGNTINQAIASGKITSQTDSANVFSQVVYPWLQSQGVMTNLNEVDVHGNNEGQLLLGALYNVTNGLMTGSFNSQTQDYYGHALTNIPTITGVSQPQATPTPIPRAVAGSTGTPNGFPRVQMAAHGGEITHNYNDEPEYQYEQMKEIQDPRLQAIIQHLADGGFVKKMSAKKQGPEEEHGGSQHWKDVFGNMKRKGQFIENYKGSSNGNNNDVPRETNNVPPFMPGAAFMQNEAANGPGTQGAVNAHGVAYNLQNPAHKAAFDKIESLRKNGQSNPLWESDIQRTAGLSPSAAAPIATQVSVPNTPTQASTNNVPQAQPQHTLLSQIQSGKYEKPEAAQDTKGHPDYQPGDEAVHPITGLTVGAMRRAMEAGRKAGGNTEKKAAQKRSTNTYFKQQKPQYRHYVDGGEVTDDDSDENAPDDTAPASTTQSTLPDGSQTTPDDISDSAFNFGIMRALRNAGQNPANATKIAQQLISQGGSKASILANIQKNPASITSMVMDQTTPAIDPTQQQKSFSEGYGNVINDPGFKARQSPSGRLEGAWAYHASTGGQQPVDQVGAANDPLMKQFMMKQEGQSNALTQDLAHVSSSLTNQNQVQNNIQNTQKTGEGAINFNRLAGANDPNSDASKAAQASAAQVAKQYGIPLPPNVNQMSAAQIKDWADAQKENMQGSAAYGQTKAATALTGAQTQDAQIKNYLIGQEQGIPGIRGPGGSTPYAAAPSAPSVPGRVPTAPGASPAADNAPDKSDPLVQAGITPDMSPQKRDVMSMTEQYADPNKLATMKRNIGLQAGYSNATADRTNQKAALLRMMNKAATAPDNIVSKWLPGVYSTFKDDFEQYNKDYSQMLDSMGGKNTDAARSIAGAALPPITHFKSNANVESGLMPAMASMLKTDFVEKVLRSASANGRRIINQVDTAQLFDKTKVYSVVDAKGFPLTSFSSNGFQNGFLVVPPGANLSGTINNALKKIPQGAKLVDALNPEGNHG